MAPTHAPERLLEIARDTTCLDHFLRLSLELLTVPRDATRVDVNGQRFVLGMESVRWEQYAERWPVYARELAPVSERGGQGVVVDVEVLGQRNLERTAYWSELARPQRFGASLVAPLIVAGQKVGALVLSRASLTFSDSERACVEVLRMPFAIAAAAVAATRKPEPNLAGLSAREKDVASYLGLGLTNAEIAVACGTSVNTVRNQVASVLRKLGAANRAEAVGRMLQS